MPSIKLPPAITTGLKALGVDPTELLRRAGLPLTLFSMGQILVTTEQLFALWQGIGELSGDPAIGLKLADQVPVAQHHPASIAAHHARNLRDGLQRMARYKLLCGSEEMRLSEKGSECVLEFIWLLSREKDPLMLLDAAFASMLQLGGAVPASLSGRYGSRSAKPTNTGRSGNAILVVRSNSERRGMRLYSVKAISSSLSSLTTLNWWQCLARNSIGNWLEQSRSLRLRVASNGC